MCDTCREAGHETEFPRSIGRVTMIQLLSNAAGAFVGGVFVGVVGDLRLTLLVGALLNLGAVGVAVTFREPKVERTPESTYVEQLVQGLRVVRRREGVALLIGVEVFLGVTLYVMAVFRPLYLQALGLSESAIAISISGFLLVAAIWSAFAGTITRVLGEFGPLALLVLMASAAFFGMYGAGQFPGSALLQVPLYIVWSLQPALTTAFLNRRLEPGQRATVLSMGAFAYTLGLVVVEPFAGALTTTTGLLNLGLFLGIVTFFPCAYILARWRTTVAAWPAVTPLPSRLIAGHRVSRFHRLLERMSRLRPCPSGRPPRVASRDDTHPRCRARVQRAPAPPTPQASHGLRPLSPGCPRFPSGRAANHGSPTRPGGGWRPPNRATCRASSRSQRSPRPGLEFRRSRARGLRPRGT